MKSLPDMDELLDRLENEPLQLIADSNSAAQDPSLEQEQDEQIVSTISLYGEKMCDNEEESNGRQSRSWQNDSIYADAEGQIVPEQQHKEIPMVFTCPKFVCDRQNEQIIGSQTHATEKCVEAFKHGNKPNEKRDDDNDEDLFEQIDRMAAQIKAEELGSEVAETQLDEFDKQFPINEDCSEYIDNFVEEMVTSILELVLAEAIVETKNEEKVNNGEKGEQMSKGRKEDETTGKAETAGEEKGTETEAQKVSDMPFHNQSASSLSSPSSSMPIPPPTSKERRNNSLAIVHDLSVALDEFKLTESELQLGKKKPYWIPDDECLDCMLCATRFSLVNRRHHCRACGRVLCRICCSKRRLLAYMDEKEGKQRVCVPCNRTLDRIDEYEQRMHNSSDQREAHGEEIWQNLIAPDATQQPMGQTNDATNHSLRQSDVSTSKNVLTRPKKKSLLKQSSSAVGSSAVVVDHRIETASSSGADNAQPLEQTQPMASNSMTITNKRSVTFRDGVNPGHDGNTPNSQSAEQSSTNSIKSVSAQSALYQWLIKDRPTSAVDHSFVKNPPIPSTENGINELANDNKKLPRKMSRRSKERRMEEEAQSLLIIKSDGNQTPNECRIWLVERRSDGAEEMVRRELAEVGRALCASEDEGREWTIALRRNFHLRIERRKMRAEDQFPTLAVSTHGLASLGVDELFLAFQYEPTIFAENEKVNAKSELLALLQQYDLIFRQCLDSEETASIDYKMGIRKCVSRMSRLYPLFRKGHSLFGHKVASILFHRPHFKQDFNNFRPPSHPFLIGIFVQVEELPLAKCVPCRLLLRLGMFSGKYPFPVVNVCRERPLFTTNAVQSSVLKVLNDFHFWSYRMPHLSGCIVTIRDNTAVMILSSWALDDLRQIVASNRNMIGWALDQLSALADADVEDGITEIDSHLVCMQEEADDDSVTPSFVTRVFSDKDNSSDSTTVTTKKVIGVSFVIFDGALRGSERLSLSLVEDGLVVRLNADLMEQLVKALTTGDDFSVTNDHQHCFSIAFRDSNDPCSPPESECQKSTVEALSDSPGALHSPIDGKPLDGHVQYGLDRSRLLRSLHFFQFSSEWALRLSAVINMSPGKFPSALQPRFFDLCEQLTKHIVPTLEPFLQELVAAEQRSISLRVHANGEAISYETEKWLALPEQHFVWTVTLDEQLIPFLYGLCAWLPSVFYVEIHTFIVSTRPLPALTVPDSPGES